MAAHIVVTYEDGSSLDAFLTDDLLDELVSRTMAEGFDWQEMGTFSIGRI